MSTPQDLANFRPIVSNDGQLASVQQYLAANGESTGDRVICGQSLGGFHFTMYPDRGLDLGQLEFAGMPIGWVGPAGFPAANRFPPDGEGGLGILRAFSGFLVTCGYDYFGGATESPADHFAYPLRNRQVYPVHGRAWTLPANLEQCRISWEAAEPEIVIEGLLAQRTLLGEQIVNRRTYRFAVGKPVLELHDRVCNVGHKPVPHRLLYHLNLGYPLIDTGTTIEGLPVDPAYPSPLPPLGAAQNEQFRPLKRQDCQDLITVRRPEPEGFAFGIELCSPTFTHVLQWWNRYPGMNVIGIEPASAGLPETNPDGLWRPDIWLQPGETAEYRLRFTACR